MVIAMSNRNTEKMFAKFSSIRTRTFHYLVRFSIENTPAWDDTFVRTAEIVLSSKLEPGSPQLILKCTGVVEIVVHSLNSMGGCIVTVYDISDWGLEGIQYQIKDVENEWFSLRCKDFDFSIQEPATETGDEGPENDRTA
jgi:hypothetical protein